MSETDEINIKYSVERKEYVISFLFGSYKSKTMIVLFLVGFLFLGLSLYHLPELRLGEYFPVSLTISFGLAFVVFAPFILVWLGSKKYSVHPELYETRQLTINSDNIIVRGQTFQYTITTNMIHNLQLNHKVYYLTSPEKILLIPSRCLTESNNLKINAIFREIGVN
ncbi:MAG: hypothetical protein COA99_11905 [Moraxellaceae bacterium]|nr:MAG: hypothetical protein COA99_11905 [Moraxellaceae bacterium]